MADLSPVAANLHDLALRAFGHKPTPGQAEVLKALSWFVADGSDRDLFILNGYAGTGKTSVVAAIIRAMDILKRRVVILAPTGRAANVASSFSSHPASTIHRRLFRPAPGDTTGSHYILAPNTLRDAIFIVDEASLIPDGIAEADPLLTKLVRYVYSSPGCRMILVGDDAQLPPVGQDVSTALLPERFARLGLSPMLRRLDEVVRQQADSGIIANATIVRRMLFASGNPQLILPVSGHTDISLLPQEDFMDTYAASVSEVGSEETIIITRSNWRANAINNAIRNQVNFAEDPLERGDRLIVAKNDYFWGGANEVKNKLIANGDSATVNWVGATEKHYGRFFTEAEIELADGTLLNVWIMLRSLASEGPSISRAEMNRFHSVVMDSYDGVYSEKLAAAMADPFYNGLQVKYGYCVTCHKAQGGQWKNVFIDMAGIDPTTIDSNFYRWLYTAITRATGHVYFVNPTVMVE